MRTRPMMCGPRAKSRLQSFGFAVFALFATLLPLQIQAAIFGVDDRVAITPASPWYSTARSTAVAVLSSNWEPTAEGKIKLSVGSLRDFVCSTERFSADSSLSHACTGFLVAPDLIATAGHCMVNTGESRNETESYCEAFSWLFDYHSSMAGKTQVDDIPAENLYRCKRVVYAVKDERTPYRDFALVQLERPVTGRTPLPLASGPIAKKEVLSAIGYPLGTPAKLSQRATVLQDDPGHQIFITNLDVFEGNSGSPVFNSQREVVGILIGGTPMHSLFNRTAGACELYNRCAEDGSRCLLPDKDTSVLPSFQRTGSEVQRIAPLKQLVEEVIGGSN